MAVPVAALPVGSVVDARPLVDGLLAMRGASMTVLDERDEEKPPKDRLYRCHWCDVWVCGTWHADAFQAWDWWACRGCFNAMVNA